MAAETGKRFIDFRLQNQDGKTVTLGDFAGKWLVVYVYPKDDTPGCTIQGKSFTATKQEFDDAGISVVGVSADDVASHKDFCNKFSFTIDLLADPNHELLEAAGVRAKRLQRHDVLEPHFLRDRSRRRAAKDLREGKSGRTRANPAERDQGDAGWRIKRRDSLSRSLAGAERAG